MKSELSRLLALLIFIFGIIAIAFLTAFKVADLINFVQFIIGLVISGLVLWQDALWIDRHFVDGEWI